MSAQFGVEEGIQKLTATALCLEAASFDTFWPVLGDFIFDRENELKIEKFHLGWKVVSNIFPTSYPTPDLDTVKASESHLKVALCIRLGALRIQGVLRIQGALGIRPHFSVQICMCAMQQGRATRWVRRATHWNFCPELRQNSLKTPLLKHRNTGRLWSTARSWFSKIYCK